MYEGIVSRLSERFLGHQNKERKGSGMTDISFVDIEEISNHLHHHEGKRPFKENVLPPPCASPEVKEVSIEVKEANKTELPSYYSLALDPVQQASPVVEIWNGEFGDRKNEPFEYQFPGSVTFFYEGPPETSWSRILDCRNDDGIFAESDRRWQLHDFASLVPFPHYRYDSKIHYLSSNYTQIPKTTNEIQTGYGETVLIPDGDLITYEICCRVSATRPGGRPTVGEEPNHRSLQTLSFGMFLDHVYRSTAWMDTGQSFQLTVLSKDEPFLLSYYRNSSVTLSNPVNRSFLQVLSPDEFTFQPPRTLLLGVFTRPIYELTTWVHCKRCFIEKEAFIKPAISLNYPSIDDHSSEYYNYLELDTRDDLLLALSPSWPLSPSDESIHEKWLCSRLPSIDPVEETFLTKIAWNDVYISCKNLAKTILDGTLDDCDISGSMESELNDMTRRCIPRTTDSHSDQDLNSDCNDVISLVSGLDFKVCEAAVSLLSRKDLSGTARNLINCELISDACDRGRDELSYESMSVPNNLHPEKELLIWMKIVNQITTQQLHDSAGLVPFPHYGHDLRTCLSGDWTLEEYLRTNFSTRDSRWTAAILSVQTWKDTGWSSQVLRTRFSAYVPRLPRMTSPRGQGPLFPLMLLLETFLNLAHPPVPLLDTG